MNKNLEIMKECGAFLEGHFLLSSGNHSGGYCQCAKLLRFPDKSKTVLECVANQIKNFNITKICGPAMGGIIVAYELSRQIGAEAIFTERKDEQMQLRRGFTVDKNDTVLIAEDVITTGKSTMETANILKSFGANVIGVACIIDRRESDCEFSLPVYSALKLDIPIFSPENCPLCKQNLPVVKPGSRKI